MSQCATYQAWASISTQESWSENEYMKRPCDLVETQDLLDWQAFTNLISMYGNSSYFLPNVTGTGVPLSSILAAHHNLVTYGVPFEWTRPKTKSGNEEISIKRYYAPEEVVQQLASSALFKGDSLVQKWVNANVDKMVPEAIEYVPGMTKWVDIAKLCWRTDRHGTCAIAHYKEKWKAIQANIHPMGETPSSDVDPAEAAAESR